GSCQETSGVENPDDVVWPPAGWIISIGGFDEKTDLDPNFLSARNAVPAHRGARENPVRGILQGRNQRHPFRLQGYSSFP
ncbi:MAG: hypothetical protein J0I08_23325, partial [Rhizobiales bacterium]|nr:hypothetical protein [Hyphomicrobiales bacterium]